MKNIDFGVPSLVELKTIEECAELCIETELQFIEINMNMPQYSVEAIDINAMKRAKARGIYFTFHLDDNFNFADFNPKVAKAYTDTILSTIEIAKELKCPIINIHMSEGAHFKLPYEKDRVNLFEEYSDLYYESLLSFRTLCENAINDSDIKICIENLGGFKPFLEKGIETLLECEVFQLTLDIGHDYCAGNIDRTLLEKHKKRIKHMHIHDAKGERCHLVLGAGEIDIKDKLALAYSQKCRCVIETNTVSALRESVAYLKAL